MTKDAGPSTAYIHAHKNLPMGVYTASVHAIYPDGTATDPVFVTDSKGNVVKLYDVLGIWAMFQAVTTVGLLVVSCFNIKYLKIYAYLARNF